MLEKKYEIKKLITAVITILDKSNEKNFGFAKICFNEMQKLQAMIIGMEELTTIPYILI